jgi:polyphosphate kinase 2 (PPK2 family)
MLESVDLNQKLKRKKYQRQITQLQTQVRALGYEVYRQQRPVVMVFEGWDAAGKGGVIKRLTERLDPRSYEVHAIAAPKGDDAARHYLYRFWRRLPITGEIGIFDRTWYGRVLVERVEGFCTPAEWQRAYDEINEFEKQLSDFGTIIFKFWVHISKEEQLARFERRRTTPHKAWKLTEEDWRNREKWEQYAAAVEDMVTKTHTPYAPWTIVPGNDKKFARIKVLKTVVEHLRHELKFDPSPKNLAELPPIAAAIPIPAWAKRKAKAAGIPL